MYLYVFRRIFIETFFALGWLVVDARLVCMKLGDLEVMVRRANHVGLILNRRI